MKKIYYAIILLCGAMGFSACDHEEDDIFDKSAAERLNEVSKLYTERISSSEGGWAMEYYPNASLNKDNSAYSQSTRGYLFLANFKKDGSVDMAFNNDLSGDKPLEVVQDKSAWEVITDYGPVLTFNTYNQCLHPFADPLSGIDGDYEFLMIDVPENPEYILLKGKKRGTYMRLSRLDAGTDYEEYYKKITDFNKKVFNSSSPSSSFLTIGDSVFHITKANTGIAEMWPVGGDSIIDEVDHPALVTYHSGKYCFRFRDPITLEDGNSVQEFVYDEERDLFTGKENPDYTIAGEPCGAFFANSFERRGDDKLTWSIKKGSEMSDKMSTYINDLANEMKSKYKYTFKSLALSKTDGKYVWTLNYNASSKASYEYSFSMDGDTANMTFIAGTTEPATKILEALPTFKILIQAFSQSFVVSPAVTNFNLGQLKLSAVNDNTLWFVVSI